MKKGILPLLVAGILSSGAANATLASRIGGYVYDSTQNLTWFSDGNMPKTQFDKSAGLFGDLDGVMSWNQANSWADSLIYGGYADWRLPTNDELLSMRGTGISVIYFNNIQNGYYWSNTEYNALNHFSLNLSNGRQGFGLNGVASAYVIAVRTGDVSPTPEPDTYVMLLAGLGLMGAVARRKQK